MCPQNAHSMPDADAEGDYGDPSCGDYLTVYLKVQNNRVEEISYLVFGCCASIATSSMTSVLVVLPPRVVPDAKLVKIC